MGIREHELPPGTDPHDLGVDGKLDEAIQNQAEQCEISIDDFRAFMPMHQYIFLPTRELWPSSSINSRFPKVGNQSPAEWLDENRAVEQMTWAPGLPMLVKDKVMAQSGWSDHRGVVVFNLYRPPELSPGDASLAGRWLDHIERVYPDAKGHIVRWFAHRVQRPHEKINHALFLGGGQGIGKDTILEPVKYAIGPWNFEEVSPVQVLGRFNGFLKSVILRVSEARDLGDVDRYGFYERMKTFTAAPPDVLRVDEKHLREYSIPNLTGVVITSNHKHGGIYLPEDDRRHYVAWSECDRSEFSDDYWRDLYRWYGDGGNRDVAAYLQQVDLSAFDAKAPPEKTTAFWNIVDANNAPEDAELADVLDLLDRPDAVSLEAIREKADCDLRNWLDEKRNRRQIPHRMEQAGYESVRNPAAKDGRFKIGGKRRSIYARRELSPRERIIVAQKLVSGP